MPLYDYRCNNGHITEMLRSYVDRDDETICDCGQPTKRLAPLVHCSPDGIYSYAPNTGNPDKFERQHEAIRKQKQDTGRSSVLQDAG